jgi:hypothetical protein
MMHTLRKTGRKSALRRFTEVRRRSQTAVYPHLAGAIRHSNSNFQALWASKPECDTHICLNLGFTSQNFRLSQVPLDVCYFWWSSFRMDEENPLPSEQGSAFARILNGNRKRPMKAEHSDH